MLFFTVPEFRATLPPEGRLLALDVGEKTIGVATSDRMRSVATALETIRRGKFSKDLEALKVIVKKQEISGFVIGYPINMDGSLGPRCQSTRAFANNLQRSIALPILLWDERMTTMAVNRMMLEADLSRARRAELVDKLAASYMLQGVLDGLGRV